MAKATDDQVSEDPSAEETVEGLGKDTVGEEETLGGESTSDAVSDDILPDPGADAAPQEGLIEDPGAPEVETEVEAETASEADTVESGDFDADDASGDSLAAADSDDTIAGDTSDEPAENEVIAASEADSVEAKASEPEATSAPVAVPPQDAPKSKGGFLPLLLGGIVAGGIGFAAGQFADLGLGAAPEEDPFVAETRAALADQGAQLERLSAGAESTSGALSGLQAAIDEIDTSSLSEGIAGLDGSVNTLGEALTALDTRLTAVDERLTALEKRPVEEAVSPEAIAAYERELTALKDSVAEQKATLEADLSASKAEMERIITEARAAEDNAEEQAALATARSSIADLLARAQEGKPFAEPLAILDAQGVAVTDALVQTAESGVPTIAELSEEFPDAARAALAAARAAPAAEGAEGEEASGGGLASFFAAQMGARSVIPREGDDPDAVLSRAEAAVKGGDIDVALTELEALPEVAQEAMADWTAKARLRAEALGAAFGLAQDLNKQ